MQHIVDPPQTPYAIGRSETCQLIVDCNTASRSHAIIQLTGKDYVLIDQSKNGTFIYCEDQKACALTKSSAVLIGRGTITLGTTSDDPELTEHGVIRFERISALAR